MAIRIKLPDGEIILLKSGADREFINKCEGEKADFPEDLQTHYPKTRKGKFIVEKCISDKSQLNTEGGILELRQIDESTD